MVKRKSCLDFLGKNSTKFTSFSKIFFGGAFWISRMSGDSGFYRYENVHHSW